jgi:carboxypeptidase D
LHEWSIDNIGITNGILDLEHDIEFSAQFVYNNTYNTDQPLITEEDYQSAQNNLTKENGCRDQIRKCREAAAPLDPESTGINEEVTALCQSASVNCMMDVGSTIKVTTKLPFDIAVNWLTNGHDPCEYYLPVASYLNQPSVQQALGAPLNWTYISQAALDGFTASIPKLSGTGDLARVSDSSLKYLLARNVSVALVYGDRDTRTPWIAGEDFALSVDYPGHGAYARAGFEYIQTNKSYQGGAVRQYDGLSFSRIFQAGHAVHAYQPETLDRIFSRTIFGQDVATGVKPASGGYSTDGSGDGYKKLKLPDARDTATCMVAGAFQKENVWAPIFAAVEAAQSSGAIGGNGTNGTHNETPSSNGSKTQWSHPGMASFVIAAVWLLICV